MRIISILAIIAATTVPAIASVDTQDRQDRATYASTGTQEWVTRNDIQVSSTSGQTGGMSNMAVGDRNR